MKNFLLLVFIIVFFSPLCKAQELPCGATEMIEKSLLQNPHLHLLMEQENEHALLFTENWYGKETGNKVIPVVVHIIHTYGGSNISNAQVYDAIKILNEDFQKLNADTSQIVPAFQSIAANSEIEFRLARLDPNGNCTEGITRTFSPLTHNADDNVKDLISWPTNKYLNMWIVQKISFGAGGYAYYPGTAPQAKYEGVVMLNQQFGSIGTSTGSNFAKRTTTHEVGHYFNLPHTWGSSNSCGEPNNCFTDDNVFDTPNTIGNCLSCDLNFSSCNSLDNVQNYMDYATCTKMFTQGQKVRMHAALNSPAGGRNNLWTSANLLATGTNDGYVPVICKPIADFTVNKQKICVGDSLTFTDHSYNAPIDFTWQWNWSFPGGTPATSSQQHPVITYNSPGTYPVTLTVSNSAGSDVLQKTQYITVINNTGGETAPLVEGIENASFPQHPNDPNKNWLYESEGNVFWARNTAAAASGNASVRIKCGSLPSGLKSSFISPPIDISGLSGAPGVKFKVAYAKRFQTDEDMLRVFASKDCGHTWVLRYAKKGNDLVTNGGSLISTDFVPAVSWHWRDDKLELGSTFNGAANIMLKFELTASGNGNFLYVDDINITVNVGLEEHEGNQQLQVFPVPASHLLNIQLPEPAIGKIEIKNLLGQELLTYSASAFSSIHTLSVEHLPSGMYLLFWHGKERTALSRFMKE